MTFHERNRRVRHCWKTGMNTYEIANKLGLSEVQVEQIVFESIVAKSKKRAAA